MTRKSICGTVECLRGETMESEGLGLNPSSLGDLEHIT